jgi:hypothetical protein
MRRSLAIASMAGLALALAAVLAVRAGLDRPFFAAVRAVDPRVAASIVIAAVLVQVALFLRVREEEERPAAGRSSRVPRTKVAGRVSLGGGSVSVIARRTGLSQDVVATALRQTQLATAAPTATATRQNHPVAATIAPAPASLNGLIRRLTRS